MHGMRRFGAHASPATGVTTQAMLAQGVRTHRQLAKLAQSHIENIASSFPLPYLQSPVSRVSYLLSLIY